MRVRGGVIPVRGLLIAVVVLCFWSVTTTAQQIIYNNITQYLETYETDTREYGDQVHLAGTARTVTQFSFRYFGDFTATGDEQAIIRFYANDRPYDDFRQQPGTVLWESGYFPISPGQQLKTLQVSSAGSEVLVPDIFTWTVDFEGVEGGESAGLLLYGPPSVGSSFNEFWMRTGPNRFDSFRYPGGMPRGDFYAQIIAVPEPGILTLVGGGLFLFLLGRKRAGGK